MRTRLGANGRLVIPAPYRKALGLAAGEDVVLRLEDGELRISSLRRALVNARRLVRRHVKKGRSLSGSLIRDRRAEARRE